MPKIVKLGNVNSHCLTSYEADRLPNIYLGKNGRVTTTNVLKKDPGLNQFFNNETMGALDNYAEHEKLRIFIKPLGNDMFNDVAISVYKDHDTKAYFPMNVAKTKEEVPQFFRDLYTKIHKSIHPLDEHTSATKVRHSKWTDAKMYFENVVERYNEKRLSILDKFND